MAIDPKKLKALSDRDAKRKPKFGKLKKKPDEDAPDDDHDEGGDEQPKKKGPPQFGKKKGGPPPKKPDHDEPDGDEDGGEAHGDHEEPDGDEQEDAGPSDSMVDGVAEDLEEGHRDGKLDRLINGYDPVEDGDPPSWAVDEAKWEKAKAAVDPEGDGADKHDDPWAVVAYVYKRSGGKIGKGG